MIGKVLYIEDDPEMQDAVSSVLNDLLLVPATTLSEARSKLEIDNYNLLLLDIKLPDGNGIDFLGWLRNQPRLARLPVILISSRQDIDSKVAGFRLDAEDYITKPFDLREFRARIYSKLRTRALAPVAVRSNSSYRWGMLLFDLESQKLYLDCQPGKTCLDLTPLEYKLLLHLAKHDGTPLSRQHIVEHIWGNVHVLDRTIDTHVSRLRRKLAAAPVQIESIYGQGYLLTRK